MEMMIDTKKLRLAQIRYFDKEKKSSEISEEQVYAFLYEVNGTFVNVLNFTREYPVFERSTYTNFTADGEPFGNKIVLRNGNIETGLCYIIERTDCNRLLDCDEISIDNLLLYIINSDKFFIDRIGILEKATGLSRVIIKRRLKEDYKKLDTFYEYLDSKEEAKQYKKTN